jgi:RNA polymerase sigma-70 factor (ECF subfamily)
VAAFRVLDGYRAEATSRTWLFAIARRTAIRLLRRKRLIAVFTESKGVDLDIVGRVALEEPIQKLPLKQRECLLLVKVEGFSCEEAAEIVSAPVGTVKHRIHAGMKLLRQRILLGEVPTGEINDEK